MRAPLSIFGAYRPGGSVLHRLRPGAKLLFLIAFAVVTVAVRGVIPSLVGLAAAIALTYIAGLRGRDLLRVARGFLVIGALLFAFQVWQRGWAHGTEIVSDLFTLILAAQVVTSTTSSDDLIETLTWSLSPLSPIGVKPDRVALAFSLTLRAIPSILTIAGETRAAAKARGLERHPRAYATPLVIRSIAQARTLGDALHARGIGDPDAP